MLASKLTTVCWIIGTCRGFAALKDVSYDVAKRLQRITKSMKIVSATKYKKTERELQGARVYGFGALQFYHNIFATEEHEKLKEEIAVTSEKEKFLLVVITSDRGLCGAAHSAIVKEAKWLLAEKSSKAEWKLVLIGNKAKIAMQRLYANNVLFSCNGIGRLAPTFQDASIIVTHILSSTFKFDQGFILYNKLKSVVSYKTSMLPMFTLDSIMKKPTLSLYDSIDDTLLFDYANLSLAQLLYYALKESAASEQSSRMNAMSTASRNADLMIRKLRIAFNRERQALITRELIDIISGSTEVQD